MTVVWDRNVHVAKENLGKFAANQYYNGRCGREKRR
jgi:hypothetical protein